MKDEEIKRLEQWGQTSSYYTIAVNKLKLIWKALVRTVAVLSVILGLIIAYMTYLERLDKELMERSPLIQAIGKMEADGRHNNIWIKLVNEINDVSVEEEGLVIKWLKRRLSDGNAPYYYVLSLYYMKKANREGDKTLATKAIDYYSAGQIIYRADALRCDDAEPGKAVPAMEASLFGTSVEDIFNKNRDVKISSLAWALEQEEKTKNRAPSSWICAQGIKKWNEPGGLSPEEQWQKERQAFRKQYFEFVSKAGKNQ